MKILKMYGEPQLLAGSERALHLAARGLVRQGHEVFLIHGSAEEFNFPIYTETRGCEGLFSRDINFTGTDKQQQQVQEMVEEHDIDVIHLHEFPRPEMVSWLCKLRPVVASIHVVMCPNGARYFWEERRCCTRRIGLGCFTVGYMKRGCGHLSNGSLWSIAGFIRSMVRDRAMHACLPELSRIVVNGKWIRDVLLSEGAPAESLRILPAPVEDAGYVPPEDSAAVPSIIFAGRIVDFKGPDHLLRASSLISTPHEVWIIGEGPMKQDLEKLAIELGIAQRVKFYGEVGADDIDGIRKQGAIIAMPSLAPETFGLSGAEGLLSGRPVVAYRVGGIPDWLEHGRTGLVVEPGDIKGYAAALETLLKDPAKRLAMGVAGREKALAWTLPYHASGLLSIYKEALADWQEKVASEEA